jgi:CheY-like chemotaxis protein
MVIKNPFKARAKSAQASVAVLSISDDPATASLVETFLNTNGCSVISVTNIPDGLTLLESGQPIDVIICDFTNPEVDGKDFLQRARVRLGRANLPPVMFLRDAEDDERIAHQLEVTDLLPKPIDTTMLLCCVQKLTQPPPSPPNK